MPVCGTELFNAEFYESHLHEITAARSLFADEESRRVYDGIMEYKLTGRMDILRATESDPADAYRHILHAEEFLTAADLGAYNGDSIRDLRQYAPCLQTVVAFEPDRRNYRKLCAYAEGEARVKPVNAAVQLGGRRNGAPPLMSVTSHRLFVSPSVTVSDRCRSSLLMSRVIRVTADLA